MRVVDQLLVYTKVVEVIQLQYPKNNYELYDAKVETEVQQGLRDTRPRGADLADTWFLIGFQILEPQILNIFSLILPKYCGFFEDF